MGIDSIKQWSNIPPLIRHSPPNQFDQFPKGTIIYVVPEPYEDEYIQRSDDPEKPKWEKI